MDITEILRFFVFAERITSLGASDIDSVRSWATIPAPVSVGRRALVFWAERESSRRVMSPWQNGFIGLLQKGESLLSIIGRQLQSEIKAVSNCGFMEIKRKEPIMLLAQLPGTETGNYETRVRRKREITPLRAIYRRVHCDLLMNQTLISNSHLVELSIHLDDPSKCKKQHKANVLSRKEREKQFPS